MNKILISGLGPAGLSLALTLAKSSTPFEVIEKRSGAKNYSRATGIQPRMFPYFDKMGVLGKIKEFSTPLKGSIIYSGKEMFAKTSFLDTATGETTLSLEQSTLETLLLNKLMEFSPIIRYGEYSKLVEHNNDAFFVSTNRRQNLYYPMIISCEGANSTLRKMSKIKFSGESYDENSFTTNCRLKASKLEEGYMYYLPDMDKGNRLVIVPLPQENTYKVSGCYGPFFKGMPIDSIIRSLFRNFMQVDIEYLEVLEYSEYQIQSKVAEKFAVNNLFLVGDCAHTFPPNGGQGLNTAIEDAIFLGNLINLYGGDTEKIVEKYNRERREHILGKMKEIENTKSRYDKGDIGRVKDENNRIQHSEL
jgi:2-polyprenyl-6-methoxyphenol hydroxylase-like FAD-dependent oxidoreductase